ncbi:hypothetical protein [Tamlana sp. I1]|uniref:hypothetical protein n=1 Tax=Tamlana sp. I1 TaxID=2762061 RepID=UPI00188F6F4A|nr:hypothetical protein [Tamlana sp. I1]
MDLGNTIVSSILVAMCAAPIITIGVGRKKRYLKIIRSLTNNAKQENCVINKHETCGGIAIGIDTNKKQLFFFKQLKGAVIEQSINLVEYETCRDKKITFRNKSNNQNVIEKLELILIPIDKNKREIALEIYNADVDIQLDGEIILLDRWTQIINDCITQ